MEKCSLCCGYGKLFAYHEEFTEEYSCSVCDGIGFVWNFDEAIDLCARSMVGVNFVSPTLFTANNKYKITFDSNVLGSTIVILENKKNGKILWTKLLY